MPMSQPGPLNPRWKGGLIAHAGYLLRWCPGHPRVNYHDYVPEHVLIVEGAMQRALRETAPIHHVNGDGSDNRNQNLVACHDQAYHMLLHQRQRARAEGKPAHWRRCKFCKEYDAPENLSFVNRVQRQPASYHAKCANDAVKARYWRMKTMTD